MEPRPLPSFEIAALEGAKVGSDRLVHGRWLVIQVQPDCPSCESLLNLLKEDQGLRSAPRIVVIVASVGAEAQALAERFPDLRDASWYADPSRKALAALHLAGAPAVLGLRDGIIEWGLLGVPADPAASRSVLIGWLEE
jgi:hypothetical protein